MASSTGTTPTLPSGIRHFCSNCSAIPFANIVIDGTEHHYEWEFIGDCEFCLLVASSARGKLGNAHRLRFKMDDYRGQEVMVRSAEPGQELGWSLTVLGDRHGTNQFDIQKGRPIHPGFGSTISTIKEWLAQCRKDHAECRIDALGKSRSTDISPLPTRMIDLGTSPESPDLHLLVTRGMHGTYVALSHCWGRKSQLRTLRENITAHYVGIAWHSLSKTFQDAVKMTRTLGVRYLWIDSLCIIQDSEDDWKHESMRMAEYYSGACCTIAATAAPDGDYGLFVQNPEYQIVELPHPLYNDSSGERPRNGSIYLANVPLPTAVVHESPLGRRGWFIQERLLSRRMIHFAKDQVYFECKRALYTQDGRCLPPASGNNLLYNYVVSMKHMTPHKALEEAHMMSTAISLYWKIIYWYSECDLTNPGDKVQALAGIHRFFSSNYGGNFYYGMWFHEAPMKSLFLCWFHSGRRGRPAQWRAPSWSWASCEGSISCIERLRDRSDPRLLELTSELEVLDCPNESCCGRAPNATLVVQSKKKRLCLEATYSAVLSEKQNSAPVRIESHITPGLFHGEITPGVFMGAVWRDDPTIDLSFAELNFILLFTRHAKDMSTAQRVEPVREESIRGKRYEHAVLVVQETEHTCGDTHYERIAYTHLHSDNDFFADCVSEAIYLD